MSKSRPQTLKKPRDYLSRREQLRLLMLVGTLGLVAILMMEAAKPENYRWLWGNAAEKSEQEEALPKRPANAPPIDDHLAPKSTDSDAPDSFYSPAPPNPLGKGKTVDDYFPGVQPQYLAEIKDDTTFRYDERHAWFNLLGILQKTSEEELEKASLGRVTYFQLFEQTNEYRGRLVTILCRVRRAMPAGVAENDLGLEKYYQLIVQPDDAPEYPVVVYSLGLPKNFPTGMEIDQRAKITGFYFKKWPYRAADGLLTAPTMAAKTLRWIKSAPKASDSLGPGSVVVVVVVAAVIALLVVVYVYTRAGHDEPAMATEPPQLDALKDMEIGEGAASDGAAEPPGGPHEE